MPNYSAFVTPQAARTLGVLSRCLDLRRASDAFRSRFSRGEGVPKKERKLEKAAIVAVFFLLYQRSKHQWPVADVF